LSKNLNIRYAYEDGILMGMEYYIWVETVIQYLDQTGAIQYSIDGDRPKRKWNRPTTDADFERDYGVNDEIRDYGKKVLYEDGAWHCLPEGKMRIQRLCYERKIPFDSILYVFKFKNGYPG